MPKRPDPPARSSSTGSSSYSKPASKFHKSNNGHQKFSKPSNYKGKSSYSSSNGESSSSTAARPPKKHASLVEQCKRLWDRARSSELPATDLPPLVTELFDLVSGSVSDLVLKHDASRIVQFVIKHGTPEQRTAILQSINAPTFCEIAKSKYGRHLVVKATKVASKTDRDLMISMLSGHVVEFVKHRHASVVVDALYDKANATARQSMVDEFFKTPIGDLRPLTGYENLMTVLGKNGQQNPLSSPILLKLVRTVLEDERFNAVQKASLCDSISDTLVHVVHLMDGAAVALHVIARLDAKTRKALVKTWSEHAAAMASDDHAYLALVALCLIHDDTVLLQKAILTPLLAASPALWSHSYGRMLLMALLVPGRKSRAMPQQQFAMVQASVALARELGTCKKNDVQRFREIRAVLLPVLQKEATKCAREWMEDDAWTEMLATVVEASVEYQQSQGEKQENDEGDDQAADAEDGEEDDADMSGKKSTEKEAERARSLYETVGEALIAHATEKENVDPQVSRVIRTCSRHEPFARALVSLLRGAEGKNMGMSWFATKSKSTGYVVVGLLQNEAVRADVKRELERVLMKKAAPGSAKKGAAAKKLDLPNEVLVEELAK